MSNSDLITIWGMAITLFMSVIGSAMVLSFKIGGLQEKVISMEKTLSIVVKDIENLKVIVAQLVVKVDVLWFHHLARSNSPIVLNEEGLRLLDESRVDAFADSNYGEIITKVKAMNPRNAYQAQQALVAVMNEYQNVEEYRLKLEETAFSSGSNVDSLLFVAALAIRDRVIFELGFGL